MTPEIQDIGVLDLGDTDSSLPVGNIQGTVSEDHDVISATWAVTQESCLASGLLVTAVTSGCRTGDRGDY